MNTFGANLKIARNKAGITQQFLAERFGVTRGVVEQWESGETMPDASKLPQLAAFLETSLDILFSERNAEAEDIDAVIGKFWMVFGIGQRGMTYMHHSMSAASAEARRLAERNPGIRFIVSGSHVRSQSREAKGHGHRGPRGP